MRLVKSSKAGRKNEAYLAFVREHESCLSWASAPLYYGDDLRQADGFPGVVSHHVRMGGAGGMGLKPSDYRTVPLTDQEHRELHQNGEPSFWNSRGVNPDEVIITLLVSWLGSRHAAAVRDLEAEHGSDERRLCQALVDYAEKAG